MPDRLSLGRRRRWRRWEFDSVDVIDNFATLVEVQPRYVYLPPEGKRTMSKRLAKLIQLAIAYSPSGGSALERRRELESRILSNARSCRMLRGYAW